MNPNNSPWLAQLKNTRPIDVLEQDVKADVVIVGAGIAGVMTAYFILKYTDQSVILIEGNKVAHGATGHNAGQIIADFEREVVDLVAEYGLQKTAEAEKDVRGAWILLEEIFAEANLETPYSTFIGYNGYKSMEHLIKEIKANALRREAGLQTYSFYIDEKCLESNEIPEEFNGLYELVPKDNILSLLETDNGDYVGAVALKKGCLNSALFSEEVVGFLLSKYKGRINLFENSPVEIVTLDKDSAVLSVKTKRGDSYNITSKKVVLCTNGFERLHIMNNSGDDIDTSFHHMIEGNIGYMAAYLEELKDPPTALSYFDLNDSKNAYGTDDYIYVTRRPYEHENNEHHNLICIGGPQTPIGATQDYERTMPFSEEKGLEIDTFVKSNMAQKEQKQLEYQYQWHGLMCYTPSRMRVIGPEPKNPVLLYNLGCNGVGILPSVFGGWKIAKLLAGEKFGPSIFDPRG